MLSEEEAERGRYSEKERLRKGDAQLRRGLKIAMLSGGENKRGRCSVKERLKKGDA